MAVRITDKHSTCTNTDSLQKLSHFYSYFVYYKKYHQIIKFTMFAPLISDFVHHTYNSNVNEKSLHIYIIYSLALKVKAGNVYGK